VDEEFFFPQNVRTTYRLLHMGPRHLKRAATGAGVLLAGSALAVMKGLALPWAALGATVLGTAYGLTYCLPLYGDDQALLDLWAELQAHYRRQTVFPFRPTLQVVEVKPAHDMESLITNLEAAATRESERPGVALRR